MCPETFAKPAGLAGGAQGPESLPRLVDVAPEIVAGEADVLPAERGDLITGPRTPARIFWKGSAATPKGVSATVYCLR